MKKKVIYSLGLAMLVGGLTSDANASSKVSSWLAGRSRVTKAESDAANKNVTQQVRTPLSAYNYTTSGGKRSGFYSINEATEVMKVEQERQKRAAEEEQKKAEAEKAKAEEARLISFRLKAVELYQSGDNGWKAVAGNAMSKEYAGIVAVNGMCTAGAAANVANIAPNDHGNAMQKFVAAAKGMSFDAIAVSAAAKVKEVEDVLLVLKKDVIGGASGVQSEISTQIGKNLATAAAGNGGNVDQAAALASVDDASLKRLKEKLVEAIGGSLKTLQANLGISDASFDTLIANIKKYTNANSVGNGPNVADGNLEKEKKATANPLAQADIDAFAKAKAEKLVEAVFDFTLGWCRAICCSDVLYKSFTGAMHNNAFAALTGEEKRQVVADLLQLGNVKTVFNGFDIAAGKVGLNVNTVQNWVGGLYPLTANGVDANKAYGFLKSEGLGLDGQVADVASIVPESMVKFLEDAIAYGHLTSK